LINESTFPRVSDDRSTRYKLWRSERAIGGGLGSPDAHRPMDLSIKLRRHGLEDKTRAKSVTAMLVRLDELWSLSSVSPSYAALFQSKNTFFRRSTRRGRRNAAMFQKLPI
jgi:hypothetical protein